ncbi:hypothetical protein WICPIJ_001198 [Wickerhamomyces pijperi]|uniref:Uncharacterized protein n=1 Tax=Wickerhamomyces pijperi TaxID=599730 RepID=A0A9P8QC38_WICPI|nr:hypothetical protein WICPIJ_001198 [Wickerhamomyces pijperi]
MILSKRDNLIVASLELVKIKTLPLEPSISLFLIKFNSNRGLTEEEALENFKICSDNWVGRVKMCCFSDFKSCSSSLTMINLGLLNFKFVSLPGSVVRVAEKIILMKFSLKFWEMLLFWDLSKTSLSFVIKVLDQSWKLWFSNLSASSITHHCKCFRLMLSKFKWSTNLPGVETIISGTWLFNFLDSSLKEISLVPNVTMFKEIPLDSIVKYGVVVNQDKLLLVYVLDNLWSRGKAGCGKGFKSWKFSGSDSESESWSCGSFEDLINDLLKREMILLYLDSCSWMIGSSFSDGLTTSAESAISISLSRNCSASSVSSSIGTSSFSSLCASDSDSESSSDSDSELDSISASPDGISVS